MNSLNQTAVELVNEAIEFADEIGVGVQQLDTGAVVLDFGVESPGGLEAGLLLTEIRTGGLSTVDLSLNPIGKAPVPHVLVSTDQPTMSLLHSGRGGWDLRENGNNGWGSGPAQLLRDDSLVDENTYDDSADLVVLVVEADTLPDDSIADSIASAINRPPSCVFLPTAPIGSIPGAVTMAARAAEITLVRFDELGYDLSKVVSITAESPVGPVVTNEERSWRNAVAGIGFGSQVHVLVREEVEHPGEVVFSGSELASKPVIAWELSSELLEDVIAPAVVTIDVIDGPTQVVGERNESSLATQFGITDFEGVG